MSMRAGRPGARRSTQGKGDAALSWEGLRAQWKGQGLDFDYILGKDFSKLPANSFVIRKADFEDKAKAKIYARYFKGWAAGLEFGQQNPRAATQIVMEQFPGLASQMTPAVATESMMQLDNVFGGRMGRAQEVGLSHPRRAGSCSSTPAARSARSPATSRSRMSSRTTGSTRPTASTRPRSRRTPTASPCPTPTRPSTSRRSRRRSDRLRPGPRLRRAPPSRLRLGRVGRLDSRLRGGRQVR